MRSHLVWLFRIEVSLAALAGTLGVLTLFWRDWIEALTGWSPDHHSGGAEFGLVAVLLVVAIGCGAAARSTRHRLAVL